MSGLWIPGMTAGPVEEWVARLHRRIDGFAHDAGVERAFVEVELIGGARYGLESITAEPGFGFVTLRPLAEPDVDDQPEELIVPVGSIARIELRRAEEQRGRLGFTLPERA
jgi:hypothetical protein